MGLGRLYLRSATRSLRRGGQRSLLAIFCIAVGVMAVVALRLASDMIALSLTSNLRAVLGGDLALQSTSVPLTTSQLSVFDGLRAQGLIEGYVALGTERGSARTAAGHITQVQVYVLDDPAGFPITGGSDLADPSGATFQQLLAPRGSVILSAGAASQFDAHSSSRVHVNLARGGSADVTVAGVLHPRYVAASPFYIYISRASYNAIAENPTNRVGLVDMRQPDTALATQAADALRSAFPNAGVQTVQDALDENTTASTYVSQFLEIVGLLALLIGGVGIANTMQVSLRRRRVEIAMLKTCGYRRRDLYLLFGIEAALLGLIGGILGSATGIAVSALVRVLVARAFIIDVSFAVSPWIVITGLAVGVVTALIFGLLPIVRAAAVRPQAVLRESGSGRDRMSLLQRGGLYALLVALFTALSVSLIGSVLIALLAVVAALVALAVLAGIFWVVVLLVGRIPVPERPRPRWAAGALLAIAAGVALVLTLGPVGVVLLGAALGATVLGVLPRRAKTAVMLALRSLGRTRVRTATTAVALFVGIFAVGLILVLGQDISGKIDSAIGQISGFNVVAIAAQQDAPLLQRTSTSLPGLQERRVTLDITTTPLAIDGRQIPASAAGENGGQRTAEGQFRLGSLGGVEGYDLRGGELPDVFASGFTSRVLTAADAGTRNVLVRTDLQRDPFSLRVGSTITLEQPTSLVRMTVTVAGFYTPARIGPNGIRFRITVQPVLADVSVVRALAAGGSAGDLQTAVSMRIDPAAREQALRTIEDAAPGVYIVDVADFAAIIQQVLSNLVVLLVALASLSVVAGIVIIANTTALAMLERRREMGILKAVGHSSRSVLSQVLVENALIGLVGAIAGMLMVTLATAALATFFIKTDLPVSALVVFGCIGGMTALVTITAALVAWRPTRIRPLEVLRYE